MKSWNASLNRNRESLACTSTTRLKSGCLGRSDCLPVQVFGVSPDVDASGLT